ncbi:MarR family winged helix-turn-helix transcriptional regulator [Vibrio sp. LaRot3]|uniref:MarR family winged helix-turn-helix transcriptional regulator n=1 Tax=Vibrio sp. LaRot3 TaxID=2998829 RepID=UPI0022CE07CB|nr:MarR family transcriptional regulator [Vibrio sp. LaRot3]MDA0148167.1 MarR family transcriptional regulator [Vibrio sp. LaRot3]
MDTVENAIQQWAKEKPQLDTQPMAIIGRMMRVTKHLETQIAELHKQHGLKLGEFDVLASLLRSGAPHCLTPSELISALMLTSGAMTNRLTRLEQKGLIARIHSEQDRRSVSVQLTDQGFALIDPLISKHVALQTQLVESIPAGQREQFNQLLCGWLGQFE